MPRSSPWPPSSTPACSPAWASRSPRRSAPTTCSWPSAASTTPRVKAGQDALDAALAALKAAGAKAGSFGDAPPPRTIGSAATAADANLAVISVPGRNAVVEALDAVHAGLSVMLFSDNVPVEDEIALKDAAAEADVLLMGPDCGTAVVGGVALGFANAARAGSVGIVAASGTGAQQVMCLLDAAGVGVSHCLGVGGRDLSAAVRGRSTRQALAALAADPATTSIVVVSKPPAPEVLAEVQAYAATLGKPVHWATLGQGRPDLTAGHRGGAVRGRRPRTAVAELAGDVARGPGARRAAGPVLRRHARRRGDARRRCGPRPDPVQHPAVAGAGPRRRPAQRLPRGHRLRRRRPDPGPGPPDDRPHPAPRADRGRERGPHLRRAAAGPRPRVRRPPAAGRRAGRGDHRRGGPGGRRRPRAAGGRLAHRGGERPAGARPPAPPPCSPPGPRCSSPTPRPPATPCPYWPPLRPRRSFHDALHHPPARAALPRAVGRHRRREPLRRRPARAGRPGHRGRLAPADGRHRGRPGPGHGRPPPRGGQPHGGLAAALGRRRARRRPARLRGARHRTRDVLPRRAAAVLGPRLGPDEGRAGRRDAVRGAGRQPRGGRARARPRLGHPRPVPPPPRRRPDGRRDLAVDVDVRAPRTRCTAARPGAR